MTSVAVITGAGGIGLACARALADRGDVLVADASQERLDAAIAVLRAEGAHAHGLVCDVTDPGAVLRLADRAASLGRLAELVHTAGLSSAMGSPQRILDVNLAGTAAILDAFLPAAGPGTACVLVASIAAHRIGPQAYDEILLGPRHPRLVQRLEDCGALQGSPGRAYDLSKRGVVLLCEHRASEWALRGARLVSVSPGLVDTEMGREAGATGRGRRLAGLAFERRMGRADEIAAVVAFLCSSAASYVTGCDVRVDGGVVPSIRHAAPADLAGDWNGWAWTPSGHAC